MEKIINVLIFVFLAIFPFGQLTRLPVFMNPSIHLYLTDIVVFLIIFLWLLTFLGKKKYKIPALGKNVFLFAGLTFLSLIINSKNFSLSENLVAFLYFLRWIFYAGLYFVVVDLKSKFKWLKWPEFKCYLMIVGSAIAVFGLIQYFWLPDLKALEILQYDPHFYRVVGTFLDPGYTGLILVLTLFLIIFACFEQKKKFLIPLGLIVYLALALTYSRASWLVFLIGAFLIFLRKKLWWFLLATIFLSMFTFYLLPRPAGEGGRIERTYTIFSRLENYRQSLVIAKEHPFSGVGFNTYRYVQRDYGFLDQEEWQSSQSGGGADSSLLLVLATTGIFGFLSYLWLWGKALKQSKKSLLILISSLAILIHSFFLNSLFYPQIMAWSWFLFASLED
jgi:O-antigen ligase